MKRVFFQVGLGVIGNWANMISNSVARSQWTTKFPPKYRFLEDVLKIKKTKYFIYAYVKRELGTVPQAQTTYLLGFDKCT